MKFIDYSQVLDNKIKVFLTQIHPYWDLGYPSDRSIKIKNYFDLKSNLVYSPIQIHSDKVKLLSIQSSLNPKCDAIIYKGASAAVGSITVADCIPVCLYDSKNDNIALVHSGWKGTVSKIVLKTIMQLERLGTEKNDLKIFMGPSIKGCCYEVSQNFIKQFNPSAILKRHGKYFVDLPNQVKFDLENLSIPKDNIFIDSMCTYDNKLCHSFRRDGQHSGRMSLIAYREIK